MATPDDDRTPTSADKMLAAFTSYITEKLTGDNFVELIHSEVDYALASAAQLTLGEVITCEQVTDVALKYASEWRIKGAIPELAGEIATRVYKRTVNEADEQIADVVDDHHFADFAEKLTSLPAFRHLVEGIYESPLTANWVAWFMYRFAIDTLRHQRDVARRIPGLSSLVDISGRIGSRVAPGVSDAAELRFREFTERAAHYLISQRKSADGTVDHEPIVDAALEMWDEHSHDPVKSLIATISTDDIEDFLILGFEFWRDFRRTSYFRQIVSEGVGYFFEKYSDATLAEILDEVGVTRDDMIEEALRFAPRVLEVTIDNGMLRNLIERHFAPFLEQDEVARLLR
ncbi:hypothetical protein [Hoyosella rhizosphaerae]|uniref:hypothetical protein n=1 Tax=Hoyosella rhizosphaerae TaxID=1755582 RepID=UPI001E3C7F32|nr:hypothetical protein [Hoyosella rhizosphaerae]